MLRLSRMLLRDPQVYGLRRADSIAAFNDDCRYLPQEKQLDICLEEGKWYIVVTIDGEFVAYRFTTINTTTGLAR